MAAELEGGGISKKRSWGKRTKEKIAIIDQMEIEEVVKQTVSSDCSPKIGNTDLQHPELMTTEALVGFLSGMKVPIPVYPDGKPSRERLIYLFKKHVMPKPQRDTIRGPGRWRRRRKRQRSDDVMDVDLLSAHDDWSHSCEGSLGLRLERKRKLEDDSITSPTKRPMDVTCLSLSRISVVDDSDSDTILAPPTTTESKPSPHVIKIRRPGRADTTNTGKIMRTSPPIKSMNISKSDSNIVNGKSLSEDTPLHRQKITWP